MGNSKEKVTCYWSGEEPSWNNGSKFYELNPPLNLMPKEVDTVILWYGNLNIGTKEVDGKPVQTVEISTARLTLYNSKEQIMEWMNELRTNNPDVKIILSIISGDYGSIEDQEGFAELLATTLNDWGVDGVDIDFEPPVYVADGDSDRVTELMKIIRAELSKSENMGDKLLMTAPIYAAWLYTNAPTDYNYLGYYAANFDYLTTMDYTGYPGFGQTTHLFNQYAALIGSSEKPANEKLAIGVSCMGPSDTANFTPLGNESFNEGVIQLTKWEPETGHKQGIMVFTLSYDVPLRYYGDDWQNTSGTGYPNFTWTDTVIEDIPEIS